MGHRADVYLWRKSLGETVSGGLSPVLFWFSFPAQIAKIAFAAVLHLPISFFGFRPEPESQNSLTETTRRLFAMLLGFLRRIVPTKTTCFPPRRSGLL